MIMGRIRAVWHRFVGLFRAAYAHEPVMTTAAITSGVAAVLAWLVSAQVLDLTARQQQSVAGSIGGAIVLILAGATVSRAYVYPGAHVVAALERPNPDVPAQVVAGPASPLVDGTPVDVDPVTYGGKHAAAWHPISAAEGEARIRQARAADPDKFYGQGPGDGG